MAKIQREMYLLTLHRTQEGVRASDEEWQRKVHDFKEMLKSLPHRYANCQGEIGEVTGCEHLQGFIHLQHKMAKKTLINMSNSKGLDGCTWKEVSKDNGASVYALKDETYAESVCPRWTSGDWVPPKGRGANKASREEVAAIVKSVAEEGKSEADVAKENPFMYARLHSVLARAQNLKLSNRADRSDLLVMWVWGAAGAGKDTYIEHGFRDRELYVRTYDQKGWWYNYKGTEDIVVFRDFDDTIWPEERIQPEILQVLDVYPVEIKVQYTQRAYLQSQVVVFSCKRHWRDCFVGHDRYADWVRRMEAFCVSEVHVKANMDSGPTYTVTLRERKTTAVTPDALALATGCGKIRMLTLK